MRRFFAYLSSSVSLLAAACGDSTNVDAMLYIDPIPDPDHSCIGVAGFQVLVSSQGRDVKSTPLVGPGPVLDSKSCGLSQPFRVGELSVDAPITVTVTGYDGRGAARVTGTTTMTKLASEPAHLALHATSPVLPLLVVARNQWLGGAPLSSVTGVVVTTAKMQPMEIVNANRMDAGAYFDPEPGAYGVPVGLAADGADNLLPVTVEILGLATQIRPRLSATWDPIHFYYEAK